MNKNYIIKLNGKFRCVDGTWSAEFPDAEIVTLARGLRLVRVTGQGAELIRDYGLDSQSTVGNPDETCNPYFERRAADVITNGTTPKYFN